MSSTVNARRSGPALSVSGDAPAAGSTRAPRPWAAPLPRPAARILLAGGLTLAGWLLGAALSNGTASADELKPCTAQPDTTSAAATPHAKHGARTHGKKHHEAVCSQSTAKPAQPDETQATDDAAPADVQSEDVQPYSAPSAKKTSKPSSGGGLLDGLLGSDGLLGGLVNVVGGTLNAVTSTVGTLGHTVLAPITEPPADKPDAPVILPINDILDPILSGGSSGSGSVTATVPTTTNEVVTAAAGVVAAAAGAPVVAAPAEPTAARPVSASHVTLIPRQRQLPVTFDQPRDSGVHAGNGGGDSGPGLPSGPGAPSAPASSISSGHDGPGGARQPFAVVSWTVTTTQLQLAGTSRDHAADGAGREAALPTASPD